MKRIDFYVYDKLVEQVDKMINEYGFRSRAEFFRYSAIEFIRKEKRLTTNEPCAKEGVKKPNKTKRSLI